MELRSFLHHLQSIASGKRVVIVSHANADLDAIASALLARRLLERLGAAAGFRSEGISELSREALRLLEIDLGEAGEAEACLVVDASNRAQLGAAWEACSSTGLIALIDHHARGSLAEAASAAFIDGSAGSTAEILVEAISLLGASLSGREATLAALGIASDTRMFLRPGSRTFWAMSVLQAWGCDYDLVVRTLSEKKRKRSEQLPYRMAMLKALSRLRVGKACEDLAVGATHVSSYESDASSALISLGADVVVVLADKETGYRASVRVSDRAVRRGITASAIALYLAEKMGGEGGGHERVAMAHLPGEAEPESLTGNIFSLLQGRVGRMCRGEP